MDSNPTPFNPVGRAVSVIGRATGSTPFASYSITAFNPATGIPFPASDNTRRPYSNFTSVTQRVIGGQDRFNGVNLSWQKRMRSAVQSSHVSPPLRLRIVPFASNVA